MTMIPNNQRPGAGGSLQDLAEEPWSSSEDELEIVHADPSKQRDVSSVSRQRDCWHSDETTTTPKDSTTDTGAHSYRNGNGSPITVLVESSAARAEGHRDTTSASWKAEESGRCATKHNKEVLQLVQPVHRYSPQNRLELACSTDSSRMGQTSANNQHSTPSDLTLADSSRAFASTRDGIPDLSSTQDMQNSRDVGTVEPSSGAHTKDSMNNARRYRMSSRHQTQKQTGSWFDKFVSQDMVWKKNQRKNGTGSSHVYRTTADSMSATLGSIDGGGQQQSVGGVTKYPRMLARKLLDIWRQDKRALLMTLVRRFVLVRACMHIYICIVNSLTYMITHMRGHAYMHKNVCKLHRCVCVCDVCVCVCVCVCHIHVSV
jgi:hypothetical protein